MFKFNGYNYKPEAVIGVSEVTGENKKNNTIIFGFTVDLVGGVQKRNFVYDSQEAADADLKKFIKLVADKPEKGAGKKDDAEKAGSKD